MLMFSYHRKPFHCTLDPSCTCTCSFFNQLNEIRDRSFEQQRYRASGLNLVTAAIVLWNTVYLEKVVETLIKQGVEVDDKLLQHISPLSWEHIALTGEYRWPNP